MLVQTTLLVMTVYLAVHHLISHGTADEESLDYGERLTEPARPLVPSGINDEVYFQRLM
jgi:hypothetical protein